MDVPSATLAAMRKTNDLFCSTVVRLRDMSALDHVYTPGAHVLPPGTEMIHGVSRHQEFLAPGHYEPRRQGCIPHHRLGRNGRRYRGRDWPRRPYLGRGPDGSSEVCRSLETPRGSMEMARRHLEFEPVARSSGPCPVRLRSHGLPGPSALKVAFGS
jgi:hypothetical protein